MRKISLLLIFCFLFQGCVSFLLGSLGNAVGKSKELDIVQNKDCTFNEFKQNLEGIYGFRFALVGTFIDIGLVVDYYLRVNPTGLGLLGIGVYAIYAVVFPSLAEENGKYRYFGGWESEHGNECKEDYFVLPNLYKEESLKYNEIIFLKSLLYYPHDYDISQDQNFINFQKDFLRNTKIQTYYKDNYFYRYIHYPGGKAKFEEDYGKYLYKK